MHADADKRQVAWQPLTPRGVARFARASLGRLLLVQLVVALLAAGAVAWFLQHDWFPKIAEAINHLPPQGQILSGRLDWAETSPQTLAEGRFLALSVDLDHTGQVRSAAHVQVEFGRTDFRLFSILGFWQSPYPRGSVLAFNRSELEPWWGAWAPALLAIGIGSVVIALMITWALLATVYCWLAWLVGFFANRELTLRDSWRLAGAALMPGALFMIGSIVLYGLAALDLVRLTAAFAAHLVIGWVYLFLSPLCLPRHPETAAETSNPFECARDD